jgi:hypothetical protein
MNKLEDIWPIPEFVWTEGRSARKIGLEAQRTLAKDENTSSFGLTGADIQTAENDRATMIRSVFALMDMKQKSFTWLHYTVGWRRMRSE